MCQETVLNSRGVFRSQLGGGQNRDIGEGDYMGAVGGGQLPLKIWGGGRAPSPDYAPFA